MTIPHSAQPHVRSVADAAMLLLGVVILLASVAWMARLVGQASEIEATETAITQTATASVDTVELVDEAFGVRAQGLALRRVVQMLQWREVASVPLAPSDEIVVDQGEYQLLWAARPIDSSRYALADAHANPGPLPYRSRSFGDAPARAVDSVKDVEAWVHVPPASVALPDNLQAVFRSQGEWFVTAPQGAAPEVGDLRVRFEQLPAAVAGASPQLVPQTGLNANDPTRQALDWIARIAAFVSALVGAGLALRGAARRADPDSGLGRLSAAALLAITAWIALAALLLAVVLARLIG